MFLTPAIYVSVKEIGFAGILAYIWCGTSSQGKHHLRCETGFNHDQSFQLETSKVIQDHGPFIEVVTEYTEI